VELRCAALVLGEGDVAGLGFAQGAGIGDGEVAVTLDGALYEFGQLA
jgi:hypothetical protein